MGLYTHANLVVAQLVEVRIKLAPRIRVKVSALFKHGHELKKCLLKPPWDSPVTHAVVVQINKAEDSSWFYDL